MRIEVIHGLTASTSQVASQSVSQAVSQAVSQSVSQAISQTSSHSIPYLTLKILDESLLIDGLPRCVCAFDHENTLIAEASMILKDSAFIGNVWVHPLFRKHILLFKVLKQLLECAHQNNIYQYEAHVREYTQIKPNEYTGRLGLPLLEQESVFYEYFIAPTVSFSLRPSLESVFFNEILPSHKRSQVTRRFFNAHTNVIVEDYAHVYQSFDENHHQVSIGHVTQWDYDDLNLGLEALNYASQFYDYLNFKSPLPVCEHFHVVKMYKTAIFKNRHEQNKDHKVAL